MDPETLIGKSFVLKQVPNAVYTIDDYKIDTYFISNNLSSNNTGISASQIEIGIKNGDVLFVDKLDTPLIDNSDNKNYFSFDDL